MYGRNVYSKVKWKCRGVKEFNDRYWQIRASVTVFRLNKVGVEVGVYKVIPVNTYTSEVVLNFNDVLDYGLHRQCISTEKEILRGIMLDKIAELQYNINSIMRSTSA